MCPLRLKAVNAHISHQVNHSLVNSLSFFPVDSFVKRFLAQHLQFCLQVHSLSLVLNKKFNELARASVSKLSAHLEMLGE